jgi:hypothetical protein
MRSLILAFGLLSTTSAFASSACVLYVENSGSPVSAQISCDGADLKEIFQSSGISAAISKGVPMYVDKGYTFSGCTESHGDGQNSTAYSRCLFVKK